MKEIDYASAATLSEAASLLSKAGDRARVLAGGTDIIVQLREHRRDIDLLVDVKNVPELSAMTYSATDGLTLGAAVPCYRIYETPAVAAAYPGLVDAVSMIGSAQIQGRASLGGNICNASPAADGIPPVIVYGATLKVQGPNGSREIAAADFCVSPGRTAMRTGEFLVSIHFPPPKPRASAHYLRFIPRNEMDIAVAGSGAYVELDAGGQTFKTVRVALAAVAPRPLPVPEIGEFLAGKTVSDEVIRRAGELASQAATPISDMRGTTEQRKHLAGVLTRRALNGAIERARG
ncbi:MAG: xanthine dehydrogenase family protein subunit M [Candidatus Poribacteria bacterium]|nr:xanthine dehydrogenase family protein subunit M [Candidatus Poribacteria bacterium]